METNHTPTQKAMDGLLYLILGVMLGLFLAPMVAGNEGNASFLPLMGVALTAASGSYFLSFCYRPGAIFGWYMDWLEKHFRDSLTNPFRFLFSPLGGCMYCQNTWITIIGFFLFREVQPMAWWLVLPCIFISHLFLSVIDRALDN